jgi:hypothetical protein
LFWLTRGIIGNKREVNPVTLAMCPIRVGAYCDFAGIFTDILQIVALSLRTCMDAIMVPPVFALRGSANATDQVIAPPLAEVRYGRARLDGRRMGQTR